jgi:hypothetical protein
VLVPTGPGEERRIEIGSLSVEWVRFLPGARLLFEAGTPDGKSRAYVVGLSDGALRPIAPEGFEVHTVSPDGKSVLCSSDEQLGLFPVEGGEPRMFSVGEARIKALHATGVHFGAILGFADDENTAFVGPSGNPGRYYRLDLRTFEAALWREVTPPDIAGVRAVQPVLITPDGKYYVYTFRRTLSDLYLARGLR